MRRVAGLVAAVLGIFFTGMMPAWGNGRAANSTGVTTQVGNPNNILLGVTFGITWSQDGGKTWYWACEGVLGGPTGADNNLIWQKNGTMVVGNPQGVFTSTDNGCTWNNPSPFTVGGTLAVYDVEPHPTQPTSFFVLASNNVATNFQVQFYRTDDSGQTFNVLYTGDGNSAIPNSIATSPADPNVLYVGSFYGSSGCVLTTSRDGGKTWATNALPSAPDRCTTPVMGVSPVDANVVFVAPVAFALNQAVILRSTDGGQTFTQVLAPLQDVRQFRFSADGNTVWVAGLKDIFRSHDAGQTFNRYKLPAANACVDWVSDNNTLLACGDAYQDQFALARGSLDSNSWCPITNLADIKFPPPTCAGNANLVATCEPAWPSQQASIASYTMPPANDPNFPNCSAVGTAGSPPAKGGCNCATTTWADWAGGLAVGVTTWGLTRDRRRRQNT